jgi:hypothetical protein
MRRWPKSNRSGDSADMLISGRRSKRGTTWRRLRPAKVNDAAVYGMDARPAGVKIATFARSPVFGRRRKSADLPRLLPSKLPSGPLLRRSGPEPGIATGGIGRE